MSASVPPQSATTKATNYAVTAAQDFPALVTTLESVNPALSAQLTGSLSTYLKSTGAPIVGAVIAGLIAHYGLNCSATVTANCWTQANIDLVTEVCMAVGAGVVAAANHWLSKAPARAVQAEGAK